MIEIGMYVLLGFFLAGLVALLFAPPLWRRAVRLTTRRLEATMPMTMAEIQADKDQMRAEFAIQMRRLEMALETARDKAARNLIARNKAQVEIEELRGRLKGVQAEHDMRLNQLAILEQTVRRRLPELERQLKQVQTMLEARDSELRRLTAAFSNQSEALTRSKQAAQKRQDEIERLRAALEGDRSRVAGLRPRRADGAQAERLLAENQKLTAALSRAEAELERLKDETLRDTDLLKLQMRLLAEQMLMGAAAHDGARAADGDGERPAPAPGPAAGDGDVAAARRAGPRALSVVEGGSEAAAIPPPPARPGAGGSLTERLSRLARNG